MAKAAFYFKFGVTSYRPSYFPFLGAFLSSFFAFFFIQWLLFWLRFPRSPRGSSARAGGAGHVLLMHDIRGARCESQEKSCVAGKKVCRGKR
jgi:hypothetical protein